MASNNASECSQAERRYASRSAGLCSSVAATSVITNSSFSISAGMVVVEPLEEPAAGGAEKALEVSPRGGQGLPPLLLRKAPGKIPPGPPENLAGLPIPFFWFAPHL